GAACSQSCSGFEGPLADGLKRISDGLDRKRKGIEYGTDNETAEGECKRSSAKVSRDPSARSIRSQSEQQIKPENCRRQHQRESDNCSNRLLPAAPRSGEPPGEWCPHEDQYGGCDRCQQQRQTNRRPEFS